MARWTYEEVRSASFSGTNWSKFFVRPFSDRLLWLIINFTRLRPTTITTLATAAAVVASVFYFRGDLPGARIGAACFYLAFALDTVDGALARLTKQTSQLGGWLDVVTDFFRTALLGGAVAIGASRATGSIEPLYYALALIPTLLSFYFVAETSMRFFGGEKPSQLLQSEGGLASRAKALGLARNPLGLPDIEALYLIVMPCLGRPLLGMQLALGLALLNRVLVVALLVRRLRAADRVPR